MIPSPSAYYDEPLLDLTYTEKVFTNPDPQVWDGPAALNNAGKYHPGGVWELRSSQEINGHGQQCIYDKNGDLIKSGFGAGSADWGHATTSRIAWWAAKPLEGPVYRHVSTSWCCCEQLRGGDNIVIPISSVEG
jgi:hypothetical protein